MIPKQSSFKNSYLNNYVFAGFEAPKLRLCKNEQIPAIFGMAIFLKYSITTDPKVISVISYCYKIDAE